ncbi:putative Rhomboid family membrane protein [Seiridium cardinale]
MSAPNSQQPQPAPPAQPQAGQLATAPSPTETPVYKNPILHTAALVCTPVAVFGLALPPRRLDFRAVVLGGTAIWGVSQLKYDWTGKSFMHSAMASSAGGLADDLPSERAGEVRRMIKEEKARREKTRELLATGLSEVDVRRVQELERRQKQADEREQQGKGALEAIWMGDADKDWKEKRAKREQEALSEGGDGIWGLITEQISEVFNRGEKKAQEEKAKKEGDEKKSP